MYLIIDTSKNSALIALADKTGKILDLNHPHLERTHSKLLLSEIKSILSAQNKELKDLSGLLYMSGPGSYTGLRVGAATINGLSYAAKIPTAVISKYEIAKELYDEDIIAAIPSYADNYLISENNQELKMVSETELQKINKKIIFFDIETRKTESDLGNIEICNYQEKKVVEKWILKAIKNINENPVKPLYFQKPNIT